MAPEEIIAKFYMDYWKFVDILSRSLLSVFSQM
jgi:hypothetical protein